MPELDFESDQFLQVLTDALRAGPGSPEWHQAVISLRAEGANGSSVAAADEYRLLVEAREHLESGKAYRSVRAGPGFTRKVMAALDDKDGMRQPLPTANVIAIVSGIFVLAAVVIVGYLLFRGDAGNATQTSSIEALANTYFANAIVSTTFETGPLPREWRTIGSLELEASRGLRPTSGQAIAERGGGGVVWTQALDATQPVAVEAVLRVQRPTEDLIAQLFVTDDSDFSENRATSPHELVWLFEAGQVKVISPSGKVEAETGQNRELRGTLTAKITLGRDVAIVDS